MREPRGERMLSAADMHRQGMGRAPEPLARCGKRHSIDEAGVAGGEPCRSPAAVVGGVAA